MLAAEDVIKGTLIKVHSKERREVVRLEPDEGYGDYYWCDDQTEGTNQEKDEEELVVLANAVVDPDTVVVKV